MKTDELSVFVYGTLKPDGHYWPEFCQGKVGEPIAAKIQGKLYDLHVGYPGLRLGSPKWVHGFILAFRAREDFLRLDYLEGYEPNRPEAENEYNRLKVPCFSPNGEALGEYWTYEMTEATMARHTGTLIESGNWPIDQRSD